MWTRLCYGMGKDMPFNYSKFICDSEDDIKSLPTNIKSANGCEPCSVGSIAIVADGVGKKYILNNNNEWKLFTDSAGSAASVESISFAEIDALENIIE